jgi:hypothetical protein
MGFVMPSACIQDNPARGISDIVRIKEIEAGRDDKTSQIRVELQPPGAGEDGGRDAALG